MAKKKKAAKKKAAPAASELPPSAESSRDALAPQLNDDPSEELALMASLGLAGGPAGAASPTTSAFAQVEIDDAEGDKAFNDFWSGPGAVLERRLAAGGLFSQEFADPVARSDAAELEARTNAKSQQFVCAFLAVALIAAAVAGDLAASGQSIGSIVAAALALALSARPWFTVAPVSVRLLLLAAAAVLLPEPVALAGKGFAVTLIVCVVRAPPRAAAGVAVVAAAAGFALAAAAGRDEPPAGVVAALLAPCLLFAAALCWLRTRMARAEYALAAARLVRARWFTDILSAMLPRHAAEHLQHASASTSSSLAETFPKVTILFCELTDYASMTATVEPERLLHMLNRVFLRFDAITDECGCYKIENVGSCYVAAAGAPDRLPADRADEHAVMVGRLALAIADAARLLGVSVRLGAHSGTVRGALVGRVKPKYSLTGDAMNTASRMMSKATPGRIGVSDAFAGACLAARPEARLTKRGRFDVKGKGRMDLYWLESVGDADDERGALMARAARGVSADVLHPLPPLPAVVDAVAAAGAQAAATVVSSSSSFRQGGTNRGLAVDETGEAAGPPKRGNRRRSGSGGSGDKSDDADNTASSKSTGASESTASSARGGGGGGLGSSGGSGGGGGGDGRDSDEESDIFGLVVGGRALGIGLAGSPCLPPALRPHRAHAGDMSYFGGGKGLLRVEVSSLEHVRAVEGASKMYLLRVFPASVLVRAVAVAVACVAWPGELGILLGFGLAAAAADAVAVGAAAVPAVRRAVRGPASAYRRPAVVAAAAHVAFHCALLAAAPPGSAAAAALAAVLHFAAASDAAHCPAVSPGPLAAMGVVSAAVHLLAALLAGHGALAALALALVPPPLVVVAARERFAGLVRQVSLAALAEAEADRLHRLLSLTLPRGAVDRIRAGQPPQVDAFDEVTFLFSDLKGFTEISASNSVDDVAALLVRVFSRFDSLLQRQGAVKLEVIGDAYIAVCDKDHHADRLLRMSFDMIEACRGLRTRTGQTMQVRIGLHTGPAIGGIVGAQRFRYSFIGPDLLVGNAMEAAGQAGSVVVSAATAERLSSRLWGARSIGHVAVPGQGAVEAFLVSQKDTEREHRKRMQTRDLVARAHFGTNLKEGKHHFLLFAAGVTGAAAAQTAAAAGKKGSGARAGAGAGAGAGVGAGPGAGSEAGGGWQRESHVLDTRLFFGGETNKSCFSLFVGRGGPQCARFLKETMAASVRSKHAAVAFEDDPEQSLRDAFAVAESRFSRRARVVGRPLLDSGAAAGVMVIAYRLLAFAHVGDVRCVVFRRGRALTLAREHVPDRASEKARIGRQGGTVSNRGLLEGVCPVSRAIGFEAFKLRHPVVEGATAGVGAGAGAAAAAASKPKGPQSDEEQACDAFQSFDHDGNGELDADEFYDLLTACGTGYTRLASDKLHTTLRSAGGFNGVRFDTFYAWWRHGSKGAAAAAAKGKQRGGKGKRGAGKGGRGGGKDDKDDKDGGEEEAAGQSIADRVKSLSGPGAGKAIEWARVRQAASRAPRSFVPGGHRGLTSDAASIADGAAALAGADGAVSPALRRDVSRAPSVLSAEPEVTLCRIDADTDFVLLASASLFAGSGESAVCEQISESLEKGLSVNDTLASLLSFAHSTTWSSTDTCGASAILVCFRHKEQAKKRVRFGGSTAYEVE